MKYLLNPKTGVVLNETPILLKHRPDLIPCNKEGKPIHRTPQPKIVESAYLLNPRTNEVFVFTPELASRLGMIPCDSQEHAKEIIKSLGGVEPEDVVISEHPSVQNAGSDDMETDVVIQDDVDDDDKNNIIDLESMEKDQIKQFAIEKFGEKIDGRLSKEMMIEQVKVMMNNMDAA